MSITLNSYSAGDTNYVPKMNNDMVAIETAINNLQALTGVGGGVGGGTGGSISFDEIWKSSGLIGASSFAYSLNSNTTLSFTSGSVWFLEQGTRARSTSSINLTFVGLSAGSYFINIDTTGGMTISTASQGMAIYSIFYSAASFGSATRLLPYLFDGQDYARMLSGAVFGSHTRVADRLSAIEGSILLDAFYAQSGPVSGTQWSYKAGQTRNNTTIVSHAASFVSLTSTATFYVEVEPLTGTLSVVTGGFTSDSIPLRFLRSSGGVIVSSDDYRTWSFAGGAGGGGAGTSGTPESFWDLNVDFTAGTPSSNAGLRVQRGASAAVDVRWNESVDQWEFTNDGTSYVALGSLQSLNLGAQRQTRFTMVISGPTVLFEPDRDHTSLTVTSGLFLSTYVSTTTTAVVLRGYCIDSNPGSTLSLGSVAGIAFFLDSHNSTVTANPEAFKIAAISVGSIRWDSIIVPVSDQQCSYMVEASSDGSATVKFDLVGVFDLVTGAGTQLVCGTRTAIGISTGVGSHMNLTTTLFAAAMNRGLVHYLETSGNMGSLSLYDVEFYGTSSGAQSALASSLLFQAIQVDASSAYITRLPWMHVDSDSAIQVHLRLSNNGTTSGSFSVVMRAERYA